MPELPEVEAARRAIEEHCVGRKIRRCTVAEDPKVIDGVSAFDFESALVGKTTLAALRKGKNLWLRLDSPPFPSFQFGRWLIFPSTNQLAKTPSLFLSLPYSLVCCFRAAVSDDDEWPSKFSKVFMELEDGLELSFTDKRRFARVRLLDNPELVPPISELGPDALFEPLPVDKFVASLSNKKIAIKALLLDQSFISGIGNWIADEVLYQVIEKAVEVGADSSEYPSNWIFHSREKKPGMAFVDGKRIEFITAGGRTSAFVPELQKLPEAKAGKSQRSRPKKMKPIEEIDDEHNPRLKPKQKKSPKAGSRKQQKEAGGANGSGEDVEGEEQGLKAKKAKKASTTDELQGNEVGEERGQKADKVEIKKTETQRKRSKSRK
ncbi:Formamidopyrimidine-DNA glycosylase [Apostasia shenzhenica]|uniref:Formamidopyrimidine-DNA glycosylase n=1 Tax=Apostasia shenzhenica TaxID=1088818 RepID=A0A2I0AUF7_9ASPA|nr:Formamidopyrimidine-DNA glycosylase [Apostasia shenzhenica]